MQKYNSELYIALSLNLKIKKKAGEPGWPSGWSIQLDFGWGRDEVRGIEPWVGVCADRAEAAWDSLSSLSTPPLLILSLSLSK